MDYSDAVRIYEKIGTNKALKKLFATGEDDYSREKLQDEFKSIKIKLEENLVFNSHKSFTAPKPENKIQVELLPEHLRIEYAKLGPIVRKLATLHAQLQIHATDEDRLTCAAQIISLAEERRVIWDRLDYFRDHAHDHPMFAVSVPEEKTEQETFLEVKPVVIPGNDIAFYKAQHDIKLLRSRRTKLKGRLDRFEDYSAVCKKIEELETIIKNGKDTF